MEFLQTGTILFERFQIIEFCAAGGQSLGYRAKDLRAPPEQPWLQQVFVKQYHDVAPNSPEAKALAGHFNSLRKRLARWAHFVCLPEYVGAIPDSMVAVYPWFQGMTLSDRMTAGLADCESTRFAFALANTVRHIHDQDIAHLDLKPSNIVVTKRDNVTYLRVIDFDAARIDGEGLRRRVLGTQYFSSPEHYDLQRFGDVSASSDVFTLGIILCQLLLRKHPFEAERDYYDAIASGNYAFPPNDFHPEVIAVLAQCLRPLSTDRPVARAVVYTFNKYYHTSLLASHDQESWETHPSPRAYVQLEGSGAANGFKRTYYETVVLDQTQMRGSGVKIAGAFACIEVRATGCWLVVLDDAVTVALAGRFLRRGESIRLLARQELEIDSSSFTISIARQ